MNERFRAWVRDRPLPADTLLAVVLVAFQGGLTVLLPREMWPQDLGKAAVAGVLGAAPIVLRRVAPWVAVAAATVLFFALVATGAYLYTHALTTVALTYSAAAGCRIRPAVAITVILWLPPIVADLVGSAPAEAQSIAPVVLVLDNLLVALVSFFVGRTVHGKRVSTAALRERARVVEENLRTLAQQAVADERRRIARELHDVVAHHVVVMGVLATGARRMLHRDPDAADEALHTIEDTSRTTVREMRRLLDVLRTDTEPQAELVPQPDLAGIEILAEQVREAGLPVTLRIDTDLRDLDPGVALTVFRIVQEALTNALKHAGDATAEVRLSLDRRRLVVEVLDTGRGPAPERGRVGHGLVGMRERVALYGGTLHTGPRPGGGFRVRATIPVENPGAPGGEEET